MSDELNIGGTEYVSSKRAADLVDYTQDYVGQLARSGQIEARRVSGLWYISVDSLKAHKEKADSYVPQPPSRHRQRADKEENDVSVSFDGKTYVTAARAAEVSGYHQDYIGQLAREGKVLSRQAGNRWYVDQAGLLAHKEEKDKLLAAVQTEAVGIKKHSEPEESPERNTPLLTYFKENPPVSPSAHSKKLDREEEGVSIPITVVEDRVERVPESQEHRSFEPSADSKPPLRGNHMILLATLGVAGVVIALMFLLYFRVFGNLTSFVNGFDSILTLVERIFGSLLRNEVYYYRDFDQI